MALLCAKVDANPQLITKNLEDPDYLLSACEQWHDPSFTTGQGAPVGIAVLAITLSCSLTPDEGACHS